jgi:hypothetical protein
MARIAFPESSQWDVDLTERSACVYQLRAVRKTGNVFEISGMEPEELPQRLRNYVMEVEQALEARKLAAKS